MSAGGSKSASSKIGQSVIDQFCSITDAPREVGVNLLEACNGNLDMAIGMHMDRSQDGAVASSSTPQDQSGADLSGDEVRAPIPQKQEVLVEEAYAFGARGRRRKARSVFDGFRDFQAEARQQALQRSGGSTAHGKKRKTLEDLFRPPIDLLHKGSFLTAREAGTSANRWLIVNIQNVKEFTCQVLNRDVWSNPAVKDLISNHFIFWQVYNDSEEGQRYMQFYKVEEWPYIAVLDPRTGENLIIWNKVDALTLCDLVTDFLQDHPSPDGSTSTSPPAKKSRRSDSIVDAGEDSQMEAAIQASLHETKGKKPRIETDSELTSTDSELETFTDTDEEATNGLIRQQKKEQCTYQASTSQLKVQNKKDSVRHSNDNSIKTSGKNNKKTVEKHSPEPGPSHEATPEPDERWKTFLGIETDPKSDLLIRFPDGDRKQFSVPCSSKLMALILYVTSHGFSNERYELVTNYPRRKLSLLDSDSTLRDVGLYPQDTIFVQER